MAKLKFDFDGQDDDYIAELLLILVCDQNRITISRHDLHKFLYGRRRPTKWRGVETDKAS